VSTLHDLLVYHRAQAALARLKVRPSELVGRLVGPASGASPVPSAAARHESFVALLEGLAVVRDVRTLTVGPDDTVLVTTAEAFGPDACHELVMTMMREAFPGRRVVIVDASISVDTVN